MNDIGAEKLNIANNNIQILINELISIKSYENKDNCVIPEKRHSCDRNCTKCRVTHYKEMTEYLVGKYKVE